MGTRSTPAGKRSNIGGLTLEQEDSSSDDTEASESETEYSLYDEFNSAIQELEKKGFDLSLTAPKEKLGDLSEDLSGLSTSTVFQHYQTALRYWDYLSYVIADIEGRLVMLKTKLGYIEAKLKKEGKNSSDIVLNKEYRKWEDEIAKKKVQLIGLDAKKSSLHRRMNLLSRWVTGAQVDASLTGRGENLNRPPRNSSGGHLTGL